MPPLFSSALPGVPPLVTALAFGFGFWWLATALGYRLLRTLRVPLAAFGVLERAFLAAGAGAGALQLLPYLLGMTGQLSPASVSWGVVLLTLALVFDLKRVALAAKRAVSSFELRSLTKVELVWAVLFCALMGTLLINCSVLHGFGDDDGYHLTAPKRWLTAGALVYLPSFFATNASMGFEMVYAIALAIAGAPAAKLVHFAAGLYCLLGVGLVTRRLASARAGLVAVSVLLITSPVCNLPQIFGMAFVDFPAAWMALASVLVWLVWRERPSTSLLVCLGLFIGFAGSFKTTSLVIGVAWVPVLLIDARRLGQTPLESAWMLVKLGLVALLPILPWFARNALNTGNPLYPMLSGLIPTRDWSPAMARIFGRYVRYYSWGVDAGSRWDDGKRLVILATITLLIVVVSVIVIAKTKRPALRGLFLFSAAFTLASVALSSLIFRYWLPGIACGVVAASAALTGRMSSNVQSKLALAALTLAIATRARVASVPELWQDLRVATGIATPDEAFRNDPTWSMWAHINANTPKEARVLMASFYTTFGASTFGAFNVDRTTFVTDSYLQTFIELGTWPEFLRSVDAAGIDYLVVSDQLFCAGRVGFSATPIDNEFPFSRRLGESFGTQVAKFGSLELYKLPRPLTPSGAGNP